MTEPKFLVRVSTHGWETENLFFYNEKEVNKFLAYKSDMSGIVVFQLKEIEPRKAYFIKADESED